MKTFIIFLVCGGLAFMVSLGAMLQLSQSPPKEGEANPESTALAKFPEALAPVLRGHGVAQAQEYKAADTNRLVFLNLDGSLHEWHGKIPDGWRADLVERTDLVVVMGDLYKIALDSKRYGDRFGPTITRYQFQQEVVVRVARSGSLHASRRFLTQPPPFPASYGEDDDNSALGQPVTCAEVFEWVTAISKPPAKFPDALVSVLGGQGVPQAMEYKPAETNRLVFLYYDGNLDEWHEKIPDDWRADNVEQTELVVVLGKRHQIALDTRKYVDKFGRPAPPITRYQFKLEAMVRAARSGAILARKSFVTQPPPFTNRPAYEVTALGQPITCADVFDWLTTILPRKSP